MAGIHSRKKAKRALEAYQAAEIVLSETLCLEETAQKSLGRATRGVVETRRRLDDFISDVSIFTAACTEFSKMAEAARVRLDEAAKHAAACGVDVGKGAWG